MGYKARYRNLVWLGAAVVLSMGALPAANAQETAKDFGGEELVVQILTGSAGKFFREIAAPFEHKFNARVEMYESLTSDTIAKMRANAGSQESDVWMVAENGATLLAREGLVEPLTVTGVPNLEQLVPAGRKPGDAFVNMSTSGMSLTYNKNKLSADDLPKTWADLANPRYKGCLLLPAANSSFATALLVKVNALGGGSNDNIDPGFGSLKKITPNVMTYWTSFDQLFNLVNSGQACLAVGSSDRTIDQAKRGAPVGATYPAEGTIFLANSVGISQGTEHKELAEAFINYLLSEEVQKMTGERLGQIPFRTGVGMPASDKALLPSDEAVKNSPTPDWAVVMQKQPQWIERYVKEIINQ